MFFRKKEVDKHAKKIDKLVTGLIIGGAVTSMVGLSRTNKGKEITKNIKNESKKVVKGGKNIAKKGYKLFGKVLVGTLKIFNKK
ncbi:hypothetical protein LRZ95_00860 [Candidatus Gracilibacteria bacterium]|nr:hypothetical protein [Candidatus Gracilibacteria bacterium]